MFEFRFKKKVLNPLISETIGKSDEALKTQDIADKIERLFSAKEEAKGKFDKIKDDERNNGLFWFGVAALGLMVAAAVNAVLVAMPFAIVTLPAITAVALCTSGTLMGLRSFARMSATIVSRDAVNEKIDGEVATLSDSNPQEAVKSPRFLKGLTERFNLASPSEADVKHLQALFAPTPAPAIPALAALNTLGKPGSPRTT